jgi:hypothetical protein
MRSVPAVIKLDAKRAVPAIAFTHNEDFDVLLDGRAISMAGSVVALYDLHQALDIGSAPFGATVPAVLGG